MSYFLKTTVLIAAMAATSLFCLPANAQDDYPVTNEGGLPFAGVAGIATGGVAVDLSLGSRYYQTPVISPDYSYVGPDVDEPAFTYAPPVAIIPTFSSVGFLSRVAAAAGLQPWTPQWYAYCQKRYRTFNPNSGTFTGNDGLQHFCGG
jgi:hypothetical protein